MKLILFLGLLAFWTASLFATKYEVKDVAQRNLVMVNSDALLERTVAVSHFVSGWIELNPENLTSLNAEFELDMRTLDTGLELKNMQIKDQLLSTKEFPIAKASCTAALEGQKMKLGDRKPLNVNAECRIKIKNVEKIMPISFKLTYFKENEESRQRLTGNLLKISANWEVDLTNFGISIPNKYAGIIAKTVQISTDMVGTDRLPNNALSLPEGLKSK